MMGDIEVSICSICKQEKPVSRKYYDYNITCECCNGKNDNHFEIVWYCSECKPIPPRSISAVIKPIST